jgi:hypothetical protein
MKARFSQLFLGLALVAWMPLMTGCCSVENARKMNRNEIIRYWPTAVLKSSKDGSFALKGDRNDDSKLIYMLLPPALVASNNLSTNATLTVADLTRLAPQLGCNPELRKTLPADYKKTSALPQDSVVMEFIHEHPKRAQSILLIPFAAVADAASAAGNIIGCVGAGMYGGSGQLRGSNKNPNGGNLD